MQMGDYMQTALLVSDYAPDLSAAVKAATSGHGVTPQLVELLALLRALCDDLAQAEPAENWRTLGSCFTGHGLFRAAEGF